MKISRAVSKADSDEEMIQTGDMRASVDESRERRDKISQDEEDTQTAVTA